MKFKYGDKVKILSGFYEGLIGVVTEYNQGLKTYYVEMSSTANNQFTSPIDWIEETNLEKFHSGMHNGSFGEV